MKVKIDTRPQRHSWAPGEYLCICRGKGCEEKPPLDRRFMGDKRASLCADCAYALPDPTPSVPRNERSEFLAWWAEQNLPAPSFSTEPGYTKEYSDPLARIAWRAWQAARLKRA